jgi:ribosomal protein L24E
MTVSLTDEAIVIDQDGTKVAFCSTTCRDTFLAERV